MVMYVLFSLSFSEGGWSVLHHKESRLAHLTHEDSSLYRDHEGCALVRYELPFVLNVMADKSLVLH